MDSRKREELFRDTVKRYGRISWLCFIVAAGLGGYAIWKHNHYALALAVVAFIGGFAAPRMPWLKKGKATLPLGLGSVEAETRDPLAGDRSPDTKPSDETGLTVVEPPVEPEQTQESAPPPE